MVIALVLIGVAILAALVFGGKKAMAVLQEVKDVLGRIDKATNDVAAKLDKLADQIAKGGLTAAEEDGVVTELRATADRLETLGKDPANPVPSEPAPTT